MLSKKKTTRNAKAVSGNAAVQFGAGLFKIKRSSCITAFGAIAISAKISKIRPDAMFTLRRMEDEFIKSRIESLELKGEEAEEESKILNLLVGDSLCGWIVS